MRSDKGHSFQKGDRVMIADWDDSKGEVTPTIPFHLQGQEATVLSCEEDHSYWVVPIDPVAREGHLTDPHQRPGHPDGRWLFGEGYLTKISEKYR